jgi:hypothetical protein
MNINAIIKQEENINIYSETTISDFQRDKKFLSWIGPRSCDHFAILKGLDMMSQFHRTKVKLDYFVPRGSQALVMLGGSGTNFRQRDDFGLDIIKPNIFGFADVVEFSLTKASKAICYVWIFEYTLDGKFIRVLKSLTCHSSVSKITKK